MIEPDDFVAYMAAALAPPVRPPDREFVARVDLAVAEAEWFRRWRRRALQRIGGEATMLVGLAAMVVTIVRAPHLQPVFDAVPLALPGFAAAALMLWLALNPPRLGIHG